MHEIGDGPGELGCFLHAATRLRQDFQSRPFACKYVAIALVDWNAIRLGATFSEGHRAAIILDLETVFDPGVHVEQLVGQAPVDRHPYQRESKRVPSSMTPDGWAEHAISRWLIIERQLLRETQ